MCQSSKVTIPLLCQINPVPLTLLSTSLQSIWDWTMYMSESTSPVHSLSFLLASLRSELTFLWTCWKLRRRECETKHGLAVWKVGEIIEAVKRLKGKGKSQFEWLQKDSSTQCCNTPPRVVWMKLLLNVLVYKESTVWWDRVTALDQFLQPLSDSVPLRDLTGPDGWKHGNWDPVRSSFADVEGM